MKATCPKCHAEIPLEDINVSTDLALCRQCSQTFSFAELTRERDIPDVDPSRPPPGAWYKSQGIDFEVGANTRSWAALFLVPFTLLWSGVSLGGIYGTQIAKGRFEPIQSLFGLPFLLGSCILVPITLLMVFGKLAVRGSGDQGSLFIGIGPFGYTRRFRWGEIRSVRCSLTQWQQNGKSQPLIELEGPNPIRFGSQLSEKRRDFILAVLRRKVRTA